MDIKNYIPSGMGRKQKFVTFEKKPEVKYEETAAIAEFEEHLIRHTNPLTPESVAFELVNCDHIRIWSIIEHPVAITPELANFIELHRNKSLITFFSELEEALNTKQLREADVLVVDRLMSDYLATLFITVYGTHLPLTSQLRNMIDSFTPYLHKLENEGYLDSAEVAEILNTSVYQAIPKPLENQLVYRSLYIKENTNYAELKLNKQLRTRLLSEQTRTFITTSRFKSINRIYIVTKDAAVLRLMGTDQVNNIVGLLREHQYV